MSAGEIGVTIAPTGRPRFAIPTTERGAPSQLVAVHDSNDFSRLGTCVSTLT